MKDRTMLVHYDLAKPALKRAGDDKAPKEERDVLFVERILKMLRPGGRAAIVLPQGKFNNSSLAFIREWILKKARLLAVVGLHPNTFKPHTGTKTSVLFVQKYTQKQLADITRVHDEVARNCPTYETEIQTLLDGNDGEVLEEAISDAVAELIAETFSEPEAEEPAEDNGESDSGDEEIVELPNDEERIAQVEENVDNLKAELIGVEQKLATLDGDLKAIEQQQQLDLAEIQVRHKDESDLIAVNWSDTKAALNQELKPVKDRQRKELKEFKDAYKEKLKEVKADQKATTKTLNADLKRLKKEIPNAEYDLKTLTNRGRLELILADGDLIGTLKERWIAAEVAKRLDYPIFMAVSERGGKDNSGDYEFVLENGHLVEDASGQPKINQDLVNYDLTAEDLADATTIPDDQICMAEAFVRFAQQQRFDFWRAE
jgi:type I restriction enzyme M protein